MKYIMKKIIRKYQTEDCPEIIQLFYDTVHTINQKDYNSAQLEVWAPENIDTAAWNTSLSQNYTLVVESNHTIIGFGDMDDKGYLDRLFVHKDFQGQGIGAMIATEFEKYAKERNLAIATEASITAKGFFEKRGYQVLKQQGVKRGEYTLTNFIMKRSFLL